MAWVFQHSDAAGNDRLVLLALADEADDDGANCHPGIRRIASKVRCHTKTVVDCVKRLEATGEVVVNRPERQGRGRFNRYVIVMGRPVDNLPEFDGGRVTNRYPSDPALAREPDSLARAKARADPVVTDPKRARAANDRVRAVRNACSILAGRRTPPPGANVGAYLAATERGIFTDHNEAMMRLAADGLDGEQIANRFDVTAQTADPSGQSDPQQVAASAMGERNRRRERGEACTDCYDTTHVIDDNGDAVPCPSCSTDTTPPPPHPPEPTGVPPKPVALAAIHKIREKSKGQANKGGSSMLEAARFGEGPGHEQEAGT